MSTVTNTKACVFPANTSQSGFNVGPELGCKETVNYHVLVIIV